MVADIGILLSIAFVFYVGIPLLERMRIEKKWKNFRTQLAHSRILPSFSWDISETTGSEKQFYGLFRGYEQDSCIWLQSDTQVVSAEYGHAEIYYLTEKNIVKVPWHKFAAIRTGTHVYVSGTAVLKNGVPVFTGPITIIFIDGAPFADMEPSADTVLLMERKAAEISMRQRLRINNAAAVLSICAGIFMSFLLLIYHIEHGKNEVLIALSIVMLCAAALPCLPPGILFVYYSAKLNTKRINLELTDYFSSAKTDNRRTAIKLRVSCFALYAAAVLLNGTVSFFLLLLYL